MLNKCKDWRPEPQHPPKFGKTQWATRNSGTWNGEARNHNSKLERWTELWTNSITALWGHLRAPASVNRVESNGGRLLTPVLAVHRHVNTHAPTPAPTQANALAHTHHIHTCMGKTFPQPDSTAQGLCHCDYSVPMHPPHPSSSEDGVCWLEDRLGLGWGISWKLNKKFKTREDIIQRHASNMGHAGTTRVTAESWPLAFTSAAAATLLQLASHFCW